MTASTPTRSHGRHVITAAFAIVTIFSFLYLNLYGLIQFHILEFGWSMVTGVGWPRTICGLSPEPVTIPVPDVSVLAIALDVFLASLITIASAISIARVVRAYPALKRFTLRELFLLIAFFATFLSVLSEENSYDVWQVLFETTRLWVFLAIAIGWCVFVKWTPHNGT